MRDYQKTKKNSKNVPYMLSTSYDWAKLVGAQAKA